MNIPETNHTDEQIPTISYTDYDIENQLFKSGLGDGGFTPFHISTADVFSCKICFICKSLLSSSFSI